MTKGANPQQELLCRSEAHAKYTLRKVDIQAAGDPSCQRKLYTLVKVMCDTKKEELICAKIYFS